MKVLNLTCPLFLTQNDGTLTSAASAARLPIRTFASGPTNSMRGAVFLAGPDEKRTGQQRKSIIVADVGGTTTGVGVLPSGFLRQVASFIEAGGMRTNFSMVDVQSIGPGGGSRVMASETPQGRTVAVRPDSVGHYITRDAKVFGGDIMTTTGIVVASGRANLGERRKEQPWTHLTDGERSSSSTLLQSPVGTYRIGQGPNNATDAPHRASLRFAAGQHPQHPLSPNLSAALWFWQPRAPIQGARTASAILLERGEPAASTGAGQPISSPKPPPAPGWPPLRRSPPSVARLHALHSRIAASRDLQLPLPDSALASPAIFLQVQRLL
ncbi:Hydantoinase/oxoprolinase-domain-containing protein [Rhodofomes roseus]|uniref:Hydantoinase/oxoprolinase-domain-containing protein n=1 Tax=Rhodofomes roseus TaxID=34475 RepID=A0ABQ8KVF0_9APHY|nr:Hydantoinase/oxoprolinase-domain-containing protein [Rhodofomes roseus]KAH9842008.1 Hydantoinase/oxoprolinase-domain-containing protein [Rhodofomes roseus]